MYRGAYTVRQWAVLLVRLVQDVRCGLLLIVDSGNDACKRRIRKLFWRLYMSLIKCHRVNNEVLCSMTNDAP